MSSENRDVSECPEGYRRYVYRVNLSLPFKEEPSVSRPELTTKDGIESRLEEIEAELGNLKQERQRLKKRLEQLKQRET